MKSILITGCSSGIGLCLAEGLKSDGFRVFATARKVEDVDNLKNEGFEAYQHLQPFWQWQILYNHHALNPQPNTTQSR